MRKLIEFINELATIAYVGGIASHIVIGAVIGTPDNATAHMLYTYKELSAYILILPGLGAKLACDLIFYFGYGARQNWAKLKFVLMAFLTVNAFVFLVPMMPELRALAAAGDPSGPVSDAFHALEAKEAIIGAPNALPLALELILSKFKPRLFGERRGATA